MKINYEMAEVIALAEIKKQSTYVKDLVLLTDQTIFKEYGWMFFYDSKQSIESNDFVNRIVGNAPFLVDVNGNIHTTGTTNNVEYYLNQFDIQFQDLV